jgi:hypothetical protein
MVDMGYISAVDKIVLAGTRQSVELEIETVANMYPGRLVMHGSTNNEMVVDDGSGLAYGWLGYEDSPVMYRPATIDTIYLVNDRAAAVFGPGMILRAKLLNGTNIVMGDRLVGGGDGKVKKWTPVPINAASAEEAVIAIAMQDGTTSGADIDLIVRSAI